MTPEDSVNDLGFSKFRSHIRLDSHGLKRTPGLLNPNAPINYFTIYSFRYNNHNLSHINIRGLTPLLPLKIHVRDSRFQQLEISSLKLFTISTFLCVPNSQFSLLEDLFSIAYYSGQFST